MSHAEFLLSERIGKITYVQTFVTDTGAKRYYFDNDSKYVVITKADLKLISRIIAL